MCNISNFKGNKISKVLVCSIAMNIINLAYADNIDNIECSEQPKNQTIVQSAKWYHDSAEKVAIYRQTYNIAGNYVKQQLKAHHFKPKSWGVILDIDETVLDNSWYTNSCQSLTGTEDIFSKYIVLKIKSTALPGAKKFTCDIQKMGGYVSLISNRDGTYKEGNTLDATISNLKQQGICFDQVVLAKDENNPHPTDKNPRFNAVEYAQYDANLMVWSNKLPKHKIIAYVGDNIQDFPKLKQKDVSQLNADNSLFDKFGNGYFILPNPVYGSWMNK